MTGERKIVDLGRGEIVTQRSRKPAKRPQPNRQLVHLLSLVSELGLVIVVPMVGGAILGRFFDRRLSTYPRLTLSFIFLGLVLGIVNGALIIRDALKE